MDDRVPRRIGRLRGMLVILIGIWAAVAPQVGPAVDFGHTPDETWALTQGQVVLQILPGLLAVGGGMVMMLATRRKLGSFGGWLATAAGAWFIVGPVVTASWDGGDFIGQPLGSEGGQATTSRAVLEQLAFLSGVGVLLIVIASSAATRFLVHEMEDAFNADGERQLREVLGRQRADLRALRNSERTDRRTHRRYANTGLELLRGPQATTRPMPHPPDAENWSAR